MWIAVVIGIVIVVAVVGYFLTAKHPENAATHEQLDRHGSAQFHGENQAPAGPGAEDDGVAGAGQPVPGPSADDLTHL